MYYGNKIIFLNEAYIVPKQHYNSLSPPTSSFATTVGIVMLCIFANFCVIFSAVEWGMRFKTFFWIMAITAVIFIVLTIVAFIHDVKEQNKRLKAIEISNVDLMEGVEFEEYLQKLLTGRGYSIDITKASGDLGVDLVAAKGDEKIAIQAKRFKANVSRRAISDAVAGMTYYGCNHAMVITNSYFSPGAMELATATGCILIDRDTLVNWIIEFQSAGNQKT